MFFVNHLWTVFEAAKEYRESGRGGDMGTAPDILVNALKGREALKCLEGEDIPALYAEWDSEDEAEAKAEYKAIVGVDWDYPDARKYKELSAAFTAGDREAFENAKQEGLAALNAPEGV